MTGEVHVEREDGVATLTLDNPEFQNALSKGVSRGVIEAIDDLEGTDTRCVVLEGAGDAFCSGGDVNLMIERYSGDEPLDDAVRYIVRETGRAVRRVAECEFPTVAKLDGDAYGAGATLAIACDVQLLREDATMSFGFRRVGLAVDSGASYLLPRIVGDNVARELVFTGESVEADRAKALGLANHVYAADEFDDEAAALIAEIAEGPSVALRTSKRLLRADYGSLQGAIEREAEAQSAVFETADHEEGIESFMERREPEFEGR